jgi:hypothetical protein
MRFEPMLIVNYLVHGEFAGRYGDELLDASCELRVPRADDAHFVKRTAEPLEVAQQCTDPMLGRVRADIHKDSESMNAALCRDLLHHPANELIYPCSGWYADRSLQVVDANKVQKEAQITLLDQDGGSTLDSTGQTVVEICLDAYMHYAIR